MKERRMMLQLFADDEGSDGNSGANGGLSGANSPTGGQGAGFDYEKLAQIIAGKQTATEDSVIRGYFKQQGLSKEEMDSAIKAFKAEKAKNDPEKKLAELQAKLDQHDREKVLAKQNVRSEDYDYVMFKASQNVNDSTTFEKAVEAFLKDNPRFKNSGGAGGYRVDLGGGNTGKGKAENTNSTINDIIRKGFGRN